MKTIAYNGYSFLVDETGIGWYWLDMEKGLWEPWTFRLFDHFLHRNVVYIDLGAWIGITVLYASRLCDKCYALEPDPVAYNTLCSNIAANSITNITAVNEAIANYDGVLSLGNEHHALGNSVTRIGTNTDTFQVPCHKLETFVSRFGLTEPMFIKMDVEGSEELILEDIEFFEKWKPTLYLSTHQEWFKDPIKGMEIVRKVGRLYKHCLHNDMWEMKLEDGANGYIFTETL